MNILFITAYPLEYNTSANVRNLGLIEGFLANGHKISTYSPYPTDRTLHSGMLQDIPFEQRYWIGGKRDVVLASSKTTSKLTVLKKIKKYAFELYNYFMIYDRRSLLLNKVTVNDIDKTFDVIVTSSDPKSVHLFAEKLFKQNPKIAKKWIQYWGDPFSGDISFNRFMGERRIAHEELRLLKMSDKAVYVSPFTAGYIKSKYPNLENKVEFYPIPFRLSKTPKEPYLFNPEKMIVGYMGDYNSKNRNIIPLYNALKHSGLQSYIVGNSDLKLDPINSMIISPRLSGDEFRRMTSSINVIACVCNLSGTQIPGKIYHYVNSGKPILIILDGEKSKEMRAYFNTFDRFYICDNNETSILNSFTEIARNKSNLNIPEKLNPIQIAQSFLQ